MNYLSHHFVAHAAEPNASPAFFIGNLLPDLMAQDRAAGRLRSVHLTAFPDTDLARGVMLHLAADRRFHAAPEFTVATAEASAILRAAPFPSPPRRIFFLAHALVEVALDAVLIRADAGLADHLYAQFDAVDLRAVAGIAETLLGRPLPNLASSLARFAHARYLYQYQSDRGLAEALSRISFRVGLDNFSGSGDLDRLAHVFAAFLPRAAEIGPALWAVAGNTGNTPDVVQ